MPNHVGPAPLSDCPVCHASLAGHPRDACRCSYAGCDDRASHLVLWASMTKSRTACGRHRTLASAEGERFRRPVFTRPIVRRDAPLPLVLEGLVPGQRGAVA